MTRRIKVLVGIIVLVAAATLIIIKANCSNPSRAVKIGYFHGGRTTLLYRAYINGELDSLKSPVELYTKDLENEPYYQVSKDFEDIENNPNFGGVTGDELIDQVVSGNFDGATVGESSFIKAVNEGKPITAVAMLGHDTKEAPAHAILLRKGLTIKSPADLKGKTLATRRGVDGDLTFLKEFLVQSGLNPDRDVTIIEQADDTTWRQGLRNGTFDGGYYHAVAAEGLVQKGDAYIYRKFDWVDPELSQALLVFSNTFIKKYPEEVSQIVKAYMDRIKYEQNLPRDVRLNDPAKGVKEGLQMEADFQGMNLPQYDFPPLVSIDLLNSMQKLLIKHGVLEKENNLGHDINNSFVETIAKGNN